MVLSAPYLARATLLAKLVIMKACPENILEALGRWRRAKVRVS